MMAEILEKEGSLPSIVLSEYTNPTMIPDEENAKNSKELNVKMVKFVPELASEYARFPMRNKRWLKVDEVTPKGNPCYIPSPKDVGMKLDYVFSPGPKGFGYYHLLTRSAYLGLYARLTYENPVACCPVSKAARREYAEWEDIKRLVFIRSRTSKPDDSQAYSGILHEEYDNELDANERGQTTQQLERMDVVVPIIVPGK